MWRSTSPITIRLVVLRFDLGDESCGVDEGGLRRVEGSAGERVDVGHEGGQSTGAFFRLAARTSSLAWRTSWFTTLGGLEDFLRVLERDLVRVGRLRWLWKRSKQPCAALVAEVEAVCVGVSGRGNETRRGEMRKTRRLAKERKMRENNA